jgi:hypothetical protein
MDKKWKPFYFKKKGLDSDCPPGYSSLYSHGRSVGFLPPSGKIYEVELLMGGVLRIEKRYSRNNNFQIILKGMACMKMLILL